MHSIETLQEKIKKAIKSENFNFKPSELYEPISYTLSLGGKKLRPVLTLLACDFFGGKIKNAIYPALGIEIFHNFTLLHDDIMDEAPIRRGKETVYKKWSSNTAILSGDVMFALAHKYISKTELKYLPEVLSVFNQTAIQVCEGQQYDMNFETTPNVTIQDYLKMIRLKTAVLLGASLKIGAIIANAGNHEKEEIYNFGVNIGLAFQLKDDLLDVFGNEQKFGKKTGNDILTNKKTYLYLKAFELAKNKTQQLLRKYFGDIKIEKNKKIKIVKEIYEQLKVKEHTEKQIEHFYSEALKNLETINIKNERKIVLKSFAEKLMVRDY
ncbi:MAG: polyprenyl synthetase family protein [Bacteroidales bacterium]|nr:polyprenyl synthetase family protein [Bacteroidales bacterium]